MNRFQDINSDLDNIKEKVRKGLISTTILSHYAIYSRYDYYRKTGSTVSMAVLKTSDDFNLSEMTIYTIKKDMEIEL